MQAKNIGTLRASIVEAYPYHDNAGICVTLGVLPGYMRDIHKDAATIVPADWITIISEAAAAITSKPEHRTYTMTIKPLVSEGNIIEPASGAIVTATGDPHPDSETILAEWNRLAIVNYRANRAAAAAKSDVFLQEEHTKGQN